VPSQRGADAVSVPAATSAVPTATAIPTATFTPTATPAPTSAPRPIFLPVVRRDPRPMLQADVVLLVDTSSSMSPARLAATRVAVAGFFDQMNYERDQAAIIAFNRSTSVALRMTRDRAALERALAGLAASQGTRLDLAIRAARDELLDIDHPGGQRRNWESAGVVILLTDGAHEGPATDVISEAFFTGNSGFRIYTIGLGPDADLGLLERIADTGGSLAAASEGDLAAAYRAIGARLMQAFRAPEGR
jgi:Mg-chelatase subunit ChlD